MTVRTSINLFILVLLLSLLSAAGCVQAAPICSASAPDCRVTLIQRTVLQNGVQVTYLIESVDFVGVSAEHGTIQSYTAVQDGSRWRATVTALLDNCASALRITDSIITQQRCLWLPQAAHVSTE